MLEKVTAAEAQREIQNLINETAESHRPILITTESNNAVLLSEADWNALQETLYLLSIPKMRESIVGQMKQPDEDFLNEKDFLAELEKSEDNQN